jgi:Fe-S cluster biogenesis protein NfuA
VALHAERTSDARTVRWQVAGPRLDWCETLPTPLAGLVATGLLAQVAIGMDHVATTLAQGRSWPIDGAAVRTAVVTAVAECRGRAGVCAGADQDDALRRRAEQVIQADVAPYAAGHGGGVALVDVHDGVVEVELSGTCHGCPAATWTLQGRLERRLRAEAPWLAEVRVAGADRAPLGPRRP